MIDLADFIRATYDLVPPVQTEALATGGSNNLTLGVQTGYGEFIWKSYRTDRALRTIFYEHHILKWLASRPLSFGIPVPILSRDGETICKTAERWHALYSRLPGRHPDLHELSQVEAMGAALGELHSALFHYPSEAHPELAPFGDFRLLNQPQLDPYRLTPHQLGLPDISPYVELLTWWRTELALLQPFVEGRYRTLPWQVVHRDFDPSNILLDQARVTAVLDFEYAGLDVRALDIASALKFTLRVWESEESWDIAAAFCTGYARWIKLSAPEIEAIPWLIRLRDIASTILRIGRGLVIGNVHPALDRIRLMQSSVNWIQEHKDQLIKVVERVSL